MTIEKQVDVEIEDDVGLGAVNVTKQPSFIGPKRYIRASRSNGFDITGVHFK
jgi:hypothetical protein